MPEFDLVGVCRPDPRDPAIGPAFDKVRWLRLEEALDDPGIEMIACEFADAEANLHYAQMAIDRGKHVHLDKPPGASLRKLRRLLDDARARKRVVQMGYQWRYHPAMQAAFEAARAGQLGRIHRFRASIDKPIQADERKHLARYKGGMMFSEGCHLIDRATALLGKPLKVTGILRHHSPLNDGLADNNLAILEYPNAIAEISLAGFDPNGNAHRCIEIIGSHGSAKVQPFSGSNLLLEIKGEPAQTLHPPESGRPYTPDFAELAAVIRHGARPTYSAEHDLMTHRVLLEVCGMLGEDNE
jgi:predicted dehydrogenase